LACENRENEIPLQVTMWFTEIRPDNRFHVGSSRDFACKEVANMNQTQIIESLRGLKRS
jgi:hypothetical protein